MTELYIGSTSGGTIAFSALTTPVKEPTLFTFYPYGEIINTLGGTVISRGAAYFEMQWDAIPRDQRDQLRTFCPGPSETVYFYIPTNESAKTFDLVQAEMIWPLKEKYKRGVAGDILKDFVILGKQVVAV